MNKCAYNFKKYVTDHVVQILWLLRISLWCGRQLDVTVLRIIGLFVVLLANLWQILAAIYGADWQIEFFMLTFFELLVMQLQFFACIEYHQ